MSRHFPLYEPELRGKSVRSWCDGSSDRSFMVNPLSYFSFQSVLHDWCNKGRGMYYPVCGMMYIKYSLLLIGKSSPGGGIGFHLSLSLMVDPSSYFLLHDWCNKGRGMCCPVCGVMHIKEPLLLIGKSSPCGGSGFLSLSLTPYIRK